MWVSGLFPGSSLGARYTSSYGACRDLEPTVVRDIEASLASGGPGSSIFLQNPDGSITTASPSAPPGDAKTGSEDCEANENTEQEDQSMCRDFRALYTHNRLTLVMLLGLHMNVTCLSEAMYAFHLSKQPAQTYDKFWRPWAGLAVHTACNMLYYATAAVAIWRGEPRTYALFAHATVAAIVAVVILVFFRPVSIIVLCLHLAIYAYTKLLRRDATNLHFLSALPPPLV